MEEQDSAVQELEMYFSEIEVPEDKMELLTLFVGTQKDLAKRVKDASAIVRKLNSQLEYVSRVKIPSIFNDLQLSQIKLQTGEVVTVEDKVKASITDKNFTLAYRNMCIAEGGDYSAEEKVDSLFKSRVIIDSITDDTVGILIDNDIPYEIKREIHWQTLSKYCREKLEKGDTVPEGISVFQYQETKIK